MTSLLTVKLRRDLQATWPRILMMVVAIAVSLTVFSAVLYAWSASARETNRAYLSTEPASATILLERAIETEQMAAIATEAPTRPGVIEATGRTQFTTRSRSKAVYAITPCRCLPPRRTTRCGWRPSRCNRAAGPPPPGKSLSDATRSPCWTWPSATLWSSRHRAANPRGCVWWVPCMTPASRPHPRSRGGTAIYPRRR